MDCQFLSIFLNSRINCDRSRPDPVGEHFIIHFHWQEKLQGFINVQFFFLSSFSVRWFANSSKSQSHPDLTFKCPKPSDCELCLCYILENRFQFKIEKDLCVCASDFELLTWSCTKEQSQHSSRFALPFPLAHPLQNCVQHTIIRDCE